jgi:GrpB-like predicted nucleotidyltransferase (UPF0157 family)
MMTSKQKYIFQEYTDAYVQVFDNERKKLNQLGIRMIEHVGSTAVPKLGGKPVVDILVGVSARSEFEVTKDKLLSIGFEYREVASTEYRWFFRKDMEQDGVPIRIHVHLVVHGKQDWNEMITFRNALRNDLDLVKEYATIKQHAVQSAQGDGAQYRNMKHSFIKRVTGAVCVVLSLIPLGVYALDTDNDGLTDEWEAFYYTDIHNPDTDGDGYMDGVEVERGFSPLTSTLRMHEHDLDGDGLNDWQERWFRTDLNNVDTDGDGYSDLTEVLYGYSPTQAGPTVRFDREILVDRTAQQLYFIVDGIRIKRYDVSTGNPGTETPAGTFDIFQKVDKKDYRGADYFVPDVWWNMHFKPMYYIHAAYWHNDFGIRTHSHGCVNMRTEDAAELYQFVDEGMTVTVTGTTPGRYVVGT